MLHIWSEPSSTFIVQVCVQLRPRRDCAFALSRLDIHCAPMPLELKVPCLVCFNGTFSIFSSALIYVCTIYVMRLDMHVQGTVITCKNSTVSCQFADYMVKYNGNISYSNSFLPSIRNNQTLQVHLHLHLHCSEPCFLMLRRNHSLKFRAA